MKGKSEVQKSVLESDSILWKCFVQKGKSVGQESLLDFGNSVVLGRRIAKEVVSRKLQRIRKTFSKLAESGGKSFSLLSSLHRSNLVKVCTKLLCKLGEHS